MTDQWGPLRALAGDWEGKVGVDTSYSDARDEVVHTPYCERVTLIPFGPVRSGSQQLFGLDYRAEMWREAGTSPFHREVGYCLWDESTGEVLRGFVVPRGVTVLAGGTAGADASEFSLVADLGGNDYNIGENQYLAKRASSMSYQVTITANADDTWSYDQLTTLKMSEFAETFAHTEKNTLSRLR